MRRPGVVLAAALLMASPVAAATICVNPAGGPCQTTIQAGVNLAVAGDVVKVAPGVYFEAVIIPGGKDGLQLVGASKLTTIIDPGPPLNATGVTVQSNDVVVRNLGFRNGTAGIIVLASGALVQGNRIVGIQGTYGIGVAGGLTGIQVLSNEIRSTAGYGIYTVGPNDGAVVKGNVVSQSPVGIQVTSGASVQIASNKVSGAAQGVLLGSGATPFVASNLIENAQTVGLYVVATDPVVQSNRLTSAGYGVVACTGCTGGRATGNSSLGSNQIGFQLFGDAPGFVAQSNRVAAARDQGFVIGGSSVLATQNGVTDSGTSSAMPCFLANGPGHSLDRNIATRCSGPGFILAADDLTVTNNLVTGAGVAGFLVDGGGGANINNTLTGNKAYSANGGGISLVDGPTGYTITGNTASKNRVDFCGSAMVPAGNAFGTTTTTCDIVN